MIRRLLLRIRDLFRAAPPYREPGIGAGRIVRLMEQRLREIEERGCRKFEEGRPWPR